MKLPSINIGQLIGTSRKQLSAFLLLLSFLILMAAAFVYVAVQRGYEAEYVAIAAQQQLYSQRIATNTIEAARGNEASSVKLKNLRADFESSLRKLNDGNPATGLDPVPGELIPQLNTVSKTWEAARRNVDIVLQGRGSITNVSNLVEQVNEFIPQLAASTDQVVGLLVDAKADQNLIYISSRQLMLAQRIENNLNKVLTGGEDAATSADKFGRDAALFGRVLEGMLKGSAALQIKKVKNPAVRSKLREVAVLFSAVQQNVGGILELSPQLFAIGAASSEIETLSAQLLQSAQRLETSFANYATRLDIIFVVGAVFGLLGLAMLILMGVFQVQDAQARLAEQTEQTNRNQRAILRLLDELSLLADGDLSQHATVTEEITGAIADSVNYAIDALRTLVTTINTTSYEVSNAATTTQETASNLAEASNDQAREIASASASIADMADAMEAVSTNASESADVALHSVEIAGEGANAVRSTIDGMNNIREQIQETSKRIKRLGESSQEIGEIIGLITDIADQTNILALNAAIQASTAGEAGRGFAVVADEVQRLAERAGNATKQVEGLIRTIQSDTNEAVASMEASTTGVVNGAELAENAGNSLAEIEKVSRELADLIQNISNEADAQKEKAHAITGSMNTIQAITIETSEGTNATAQSIGDLTNLAAELENSVSGFKLPGETDDDMTDTVVMQADASSVPEENVDFDEEDEEIEMEIDLNDVRVDLDQDESLESENPN